MLIQENGKLYNIDEDSGLVTEASLVTEEVTDLDEEYRLGDRVEVVGSVGQIVSMVPSYYGVAFGIRFDNGDFDEFTEGQLKRSVAEKKTYDSPIMEIFERYDAYNEMPAYTAEELDRKEAEARWLNLNATTLRAHASSGMPDPKLDEIVMTTQSDLRDIKEHRENAETEDNKEYLSSLNKYKLAEDIGSYGGALGGHDDASWLLEGTEGMEVVETTDTDLATRATEVVSSLTREQLEDDDFLALVSSYQREYLQIADANSDQGKAFASYLLQARKDRLEELPAEQKTASVEYNLDDATDIFI